MRKGAGLVTYDRWFKALTVFGLVVSDSKLSVSPAVYLGLTRREACSIGVLPLGFERVMVCPLSEVSSCRLDISDRISVADYGRQVKVLERFPT